MTWPHRPAIAVSPWHGPALFGGVPDGPAAANHVDLYAEQISRPDSTKGTSQMLTIWR